MTSRAPRRPGAELDNSPMSCCPNARDAPVLSRRACIGAHRSHAGYDLNRHPRLADSPAIRPRPRAAPELTVDAPARSPSRCRGLLDPRRDDRDAGRSCGLSTVEDGGDLRHAGPAPRSWCRSRHVEPTFTLSARCDDSSVLPRDHVPRSLHTVSRLTLLDHAAAAAGRVDVHTMTSTPSSTARRCALGIAGSPTRPR